MGTVSLRDGRSSTLVGRGLDLGTGRRELGQRTMIFASRDKA